MGFFDFFKNLFGGNNKPSIDAEKLVVDITETLITINGKAVDVPCHINALNTMFGKPRKFVGKSGNVNFTWDDIGMYCYTNGNNVVKCIAIKVNKSEELDLKFEPKTLFKGMLTICGKDWEEVMHSGEDMDVARQCDIGGLSLFSEYVDFEKGDKDGCKGAYSGVEVSIPMSATELKNLLEK